MYKYEEIRDKLKEYRYVVFSVKDEKDFKMILRFNGTKSELKEEITNSFQKLNKPNYFFVIFKFTFHTGTKWYHGGPLGVKLSTLKFIDNELVNAYKYDKIAKNFMYTVWFQRKFLERNGWTDDYFNLMMKKLLSKEGEEALYPLVNNMFNVKFLDRFSKYDR
jgi:hypothetical protein